MATYREIHGKAIKSLDTDPTAETDAGQIWYNTSSDTFKSIVSLSAWSSASSTVNTRGFIGSLGTQTANLGFGGYLATNTPTNVTEEYDGSGWTSGGNMTNGRYLPGGAGTQTAGLAFGGPAPSGSDGESTEEYDGTSWTTANGLNAGRNSMVGIGIQTAAVGAGGYGPGYITNVEEYDGTNWTAVTALPVGQGGGCGAGTQTDGLVFGGFVPPAHTVTNRTLNYDGTSWTVSPATMGTARALGGNNNTGAPSSAALAGVGNSSPQYNLTEEFNVSANVITAGAWASATAYPASLEQVRAAGTQTSLVAAGGETAPGPMVTTANEYDGSSWTSTTALPAARGNGAAFGTQTAGVYATGFNVSNQTTVYTYNGSAWATSPGTVNTGRRGLSGSGTSTAGIIWGGYTTTGVANTEEWNGSAMSNEPTLNTARYNPGGFGTSTATLAVCGNTPPPNADTAASEEYNGSSWTSGNNNVHALRMAAVGSGIQTDGIVFGGYDGSSTVAYTTGYDGTSWSTRPNMGTARNNQGSAQASPSINGIAIAGGPYTNAVEEFTAETTAVNVKTLTQS